MRDDGTLSRAGPPASDSTSSQKLKSPRSDRLGSQSDLSIDDGHKSSHGGLFEARQQSNYSILLVVIVVTTTTTSIRAGCCADKFIYSQRRRYVVKI